MPVPQRVCLIVEFCQEQARCLFHKESVFCSCLQSSRTGKMPVPQRVCLIVAFCQEQARCLFHK
ncbi:hypothetical protein [Microcoleus sp. B4-C2]|uniref:hypothetical protein n=1 Tax=Microcoleus sp. B4-C2 TaxID=2818661 RepID=UPI004040C282